MAIAPRTPWGPKTRPIPILWGRERGESGIEDLELIAPVFLEPPQLQESAQGANRAALPPNDLSSILRVHFDLEETPVSPSAELDLFHEEIIWLIHQELQNVTELCPERAHLGPLDQLADGLGHLGTALDPVLDPLAVDLQLSRVLTGIVITDLVQGASRRDAPGVGNHQPIERPIPGTHAAQPYLQHIVYLRDLASRSPNLGEQILLGQESFWDAPSRRHVYQGSRSHQSPGVYQEIHPSGYSTLPPPPRATP